MGRAPEEIAVTERFERQYNRGRSNILRDIERDVCGCDYGGTSWTTRLEAERVSALLELSPARLLIDIGAGSGWPALYMAKISGCDATLVDLPLTGIRTAVERAVSDGLDKTCKAIVGDGCALPFRNALFDAVSHSDVLCCLAQKEAMLCECRRISRDSAAMAFTVIEMAPELTPENRARARELGPPFIESELAYTDMLRRSGWRLLDTIDVSEEYARSTRDFIDAWKKNEAAVVSAVGAEEFEDFVQRKDASIPYIENGIIRRRLYSVFAGN